MKNKVLFVFALIILGACGSKAERKSSETVEQIHLSHNSVQKIDVHSHFQFTRDYLPEFFEKWNMRSVLVDVSIENSRAWSSYVENAQKHPNLFFLCSSLIGTGIDSPDFAQKHIKRLEKEIASGAKMVKVWKNFGMVTKDTAGNFIQIDDKRLQPIWDFLAEKGIPVMAHIAEPVQAWRPLDDSNNPHFGYYTEHPQYHAYKIPTIPSYETIIGARDRWIENNPNLKILCAHMGSMSHDVEMVAERLDRFPNMYVETAARFGDLASQDPKKVSAFFQSYQNRIFFGTDYGNSIVQDSISNAELEIEIKELDDNYNRLWNYLSGTDSLIIKSQKTKGLGLSPDILNKIYHHNASSFLKLGN